MSSSNYSSADYWDTRYKNDEGKCLFNKIRLFGSEISIEYAEGTNIESIF